MGRATSAGVLMLTVLTLLKVGSSPNGEKHGERPFWREFGDQYLAAWLANVRKYVPQPHQVVVMTDVPLRIADVHHVKAVALDKTVDAPGFWAKLEMFRRGVGKTLYCDLDNVINGPLDELCALTPDPLIMLDDRRVPYLPNGSLVLFDAERCRWLWDRYTKDARAIEQTYVAHGEDYRRAYDQAFIADGTPALRFFQNFLPDGYILNARSELPNASDWTSARVIFGCGSTKRHNSTHPAFAL
jgi:hypothetical protein